MNEKLKYALTTKHFILSYIMMFTGVIYFQYITNIFKPFGEFMGHNDQYLTFISSIGMIMNCLARLSGGLILEKIDFKIFYGFILLMSSTLAFSF